MASRYVFQVMRGKYRGFLADGERVAKTHRKGAYVESDVRLDDIHGKDMFRLVKDKHEIAENTVQKDLSGRPSDSSEEVADEGEETVNTVGTKDVTSAFNVSLKGTKGIRAVKNSKGQYNFVSEKHPDKPLNPEPFSNKADAKAYIKKSLLQK